MYNRRSQSGVWDSPFELTEHDSYVTQTPTLAVTHAYNTQHQDMVYTAWIESIGDRDFIMFRRYNNGSWEYTQEIVGSSTPTSDLGQVNMAIDSTGGVHIVWRESNAPGGPYVCWIKNENCGQPGNWGTYVRQSRPHLDAGGISIAINGYGFVHLCFCEGLGPDNIRLKHERLEGLTGNVWTEGVYLSPPNARAINHGLACDNLGFLHAFWSDNRNYPNQYTWDIFHRRNKHLGAYYGDSEWEGDHMIYSTRPFPAEYGYVILGDVAQPDSFGDMFIGVDVFRKLDDNWDIYATLGRQDDGVRNFPWPPYPSFFTASAVTEPADFEPQGCYLHSVVNKVLYFAPGEALLKCYTADGRRVSEANIMGAGELDLSTFPAGIYFTHLQTVDGSSSARAKVLVIR